jgi:Xaa-Pro aminopeptidase
VSVAVTPAAPDFPREEYDQRYERVRKMMAADNLDALFVTAPMNYIYFTGHESDQITDQKIRPFVFLLPLAGDPLCFIAEFEVKNLSRTTWLGDRARTFGLFKHNQAISEGLREAGLEGARIGCELGREQHLGMSYLDFLDVQAQLPDAQFVDASSIVLGARATKSLLEIERIAEAARITAEGINEVVPRLAEGMTDAEIRRMVRLAILKLGAENVPSVHVTIGRDFVAEPTGRLKIRSGDTVVIDTSAVFEGYMSDVTRTVVVGEATDEQREMYAYSVSLNQACFEAFRPGATCADVNIACQEELARAGRAGRKAVGRIGHGVGIDYLEYPSLTATEDVVLEEGMVFACNPNFMTDYGFFNIEENLVVTSDGHRMLSNPMGPSELQVIS